MLCIDVVYEGCPSYTTTSLIHNNVPHTQQRPSYTTTSLIHNNVPHASLIHKILNTDSRFGRSNVRHNQVLI